MKRHDKLADTLPVGTLGILALESLRAGYDIRHGLIGPGVYASHNYERSHMDGVRNTFELLKTYVTQ